MKKQISLTETTSESTCKISFGPVSKECLSLRWFSRSLTIAHCIMLRSAITNFAQPVQAISTVRTHILWRCLLPTSAKTCMPIPPLSLSVPSPHIHPVQRSVRSHTTQLIFSPWHSATVSHCQLHPAYCPLKIAGVVDNTTKSTAKITMSTVWDVYSMYYIVMSTVCWSTLCYTYGISTLLYLHYVSTLHHAYGVLCLQNIKST